MGDQYLTEAIDFERDIEPYRVIRIYAGVGSGKNYWIESLVEDGFRVLLITSRKATADAQAKKLNASRWIDIDTLATEAEDTSEKMKYINKAVVTNAGIEQFLKNKYDPEDESTYLWNYFDFIVLDEAHSLVDDATFADSPFHVKRFLAHVIHNDFSCKVIFMTGTPEPIDRLFSDRLKAHKCFNDLNLFDICKHVVPTEIVLGDTASALGDIVNEVLSLNNRVIYFANSITRMERLVPELVECGIPTEAIGVAYSGEAKRNFPELILNRKKEIQNFILEKERIPEDIKVFLTTSQNKEGINLMDEDIHTMYSETCKKSALIQMAGRVRNGLDYLFVIYDAPEHPPVVSMEEMDIDRKCLPDVRKYWEESELDNPKEIIQMIEGKFPCIRYDYLSQKFRFYSERAHAFMQEHKDKDFVRRCAYCYGSDYDRYRDDEGELVSHAKESMQEWFPESEIFIQYHLAPWVQMEILENIIAPFLWYYFYDDYGAMTKEDKENLRVNLNRAIEESGIPVEELGIKFPIKQLNPFLKIFRRQIIEAPGMRKGTGYLLVPYAEPVGEN